MYIILIFYRRQKKLLNADKTDVAGEVGFFSEPPSILIYFSTLEVYRVMVFNVVMNWENRLAKIVVLWKQFTEKKVL